MRILLFLCFVTLFSCSGKKAGIEGDNNDNNNIIVGDNNTINISKEDRPLEGNLKISLGLTDDIMQENVKQVAEASSLEEALKANISYELNELDEFWEVKPKSDYYDRYKSHQVMTEDKDYTFSGDPPPFIHNPVTFDFKIVNNSDESIFFNKVVFDVEDSHTDTQPLLVFSNFMGWSNESFTVYQENWIPIKNAKVFYNIYNCDTDDKNINYEHFRYSEKLKVDGLKPIDVSISNALVKEGINTAKLKPVGNQDISQMEIRQTERGIKEIRTILGKYAPSYLAPMSSDPIYILTAGKIEYQYEDTDGKIITDYVKFKEYVEVAGGWEYGAYGPSSFDYKSNLQIDAKNYQITTSVSQYLKPKDVDRFTISLNAEKSSIHKFKIKLYNSDSLVYRSKPIFLHYLLPRSCKIGDAILEIEAK